MPLHENPIPTPVSVHRMVVVVGGSGGPVAPTPGRDDGSTLGVWVRLEEAGGPGAWFPRAHGARFGRADPAQWGKPSIP